MIGIHLCDDDPAVRARIRAALERKLLIENWDMAVVCSVGAPGPLLAALEENGGGRGIYLLDVELKDPQYDGFLLGQAIRRADPHAILIYITSYGELAGRTFRYHLEAFDYIVKAPDTLEEEVCRCMDAVAARLAAERRSPREVFPLRVGEMVRYIPLEDILFFETAPTPHHLLLHTPYSRLEFPGSLNELEKQLGGRFIRVHRAYLAAADKIEEVDLRQNRLRAGGRVCLVSRAGRAALRARGLC